MPPLTFPTNCIKFLTYQILELQERISVIYLIHDKDQIVDSLGCAATNSHIVAAETADHWIHHGGKPKFMATSIQSQQLSWSHLAGETMVCSFSLRCSIKRSPAF